MPANYRPKLGKGVANYWRISGQVLKHVGFEKRPERRDDTKTTRGRGRKRRNRIEQGDRKKRRKREDGVSQGAALAPPPPPLRRGRGLAARLRPPRPAARRAAGALGRRAAGAAPLLQGRALDDVAGLGPPRRRQRRGAREGPPRGRLDDWGGASIGNLDTSSMCRRTPRRGRRSLADGAGSRLNSYLDRLAQHYHKVFFYIVLCMRVVSR